MGAIFRAHASFVVQLMPFIIRYPAGLVFVPGFDFDVVEGEGCECSDEC